MMADIYNKSRYLNGSTFEMSVWLNRDFNQIVRPGDFSALLNYSPFVVALVGVIGSTFWFSIRRWHRRWYNLSLSRICFVANRVGLLTTLVFYCLYIHNRELTGVNPLPTDLLVMLSVWVGVYYTIMLTLTWIVWRKSLRPYYALLE
jgi:hypothetical protein